MAAANCYGVKPCLHTSANERLAAGCLEAVWEGQYGMHGTKSVPDNPNPNPNPSPKVP